MASYSRRRLVDRSRKAVYHCWTRCVRRAFLCGQDPLSGRDLSHRRIWILERLEDLAGLFAVEVEFLAILSNHLHLMLRARPDVAARWNKVQVVRRYLTLMRIAKCLGDDVPEADPKRVEQLARNPKEVKKMRKRLGDISWFMGILSEHIARRANAEDGCKGRFWETRFKCRECADPSGMLLTALYLDLNQTKAGEADSPRESRYTSAYLRILAQSEDPESPTRTDGWLGELTERGESLAMLERAYTSRTGRRASDLGLLSITLEDYLRLLEWTAEQIKSGQRTTVPTNLDAVLERLHINESAWLDTMTHYDTLFCHAVGAPSALAEVAQRMGRRCLKGAAACRRLFA